MRLWNKIKQLAHRPDELERLAGHGISPSFSDKTFLYLANKIYVALDGYGIDVPTIQKVFNCLQNDADFIKLNNAFGLRIDPIPMPLEYPRIPRNLMWFITGELTSLEIKKINLNLKSSGITKSIKS